jgi:hemerythrin-like metal-binding protein
VAVTYFAPWDWVIGAGAYADDFDAVRGQIENAQNALLRWVALVAGAGALIAAISGFFMARSISLPIDRVIAELSASSDQIADASQQVSTASSRLAEGASDQAASLEETSASLEEMSSMTKRNAESAAQANELAQVARRAADTGASDMQAMGQAMGEIKTASDDIAKIIKTIDEIAFQTNILALNAAVEAARAGEAGLGFAVVADEVRNLAQRSAQAAKETAGKIEGAITKTAQGVQISEKVAGSLAEIVGKVRGVDGLVSEVSHASREQSHGVDQISTAVGHMDKIVQSNAASAEESAAAATELKAQAAALQDTVAGMVQLVGGQPAVAIAARPSMAHEAAHVAAAANQPSKPAMAQVGGPVPNPAPAEARDLIQWDEARMSTGVASIDAQHRELIDMINRLHRACVEQRGQEELREMMRFLSEYVQKHFRHEEDLMARHQCPSKAQNQAAHQKFLRDFTALTTAFNGGQTNSALLLDLRKLVGEWLVSHICRVDTQLRRCAGKHPDPGAGARKAASASNNGHAELSFTDMK